MSAPPPSSRQDQQLAERLLELGLLDPSEIAREVSWSLGRYQAVRKLGEGASSEVFLAEDPIIGRLVVIKLLAPGLQVAEDRFQREIRLLGSLRHPHIVNVLDAGTHDGRLYFVMDHVGERTLANCELELREWVTMLRGVALACDHAHQQGVVHRDLKPANVVVGPEGPQVLDFGVAKLLQGFEDTGASRKGLTRTGAIVGTPFYMSPEQISGSKAVGPATDLHALGVMLYERLAGRLPFEGTNLLQVAAQIASELPPPLSELAPSAPPALTTVVAQAMAKDPSDRQPSAAVFAEQLSAWLELENSPATALSPGRAGFAVGVLGALALLVAGLLLLRGPNPEPNLGPDDGPLARSSPAPIGPAPAPDPTPSPGHETPVETPASPSLAQLLAAERRFEAWEATSVSPGTPVPLDALEEIVSQLGSLLETDLPTPLSQRALLLRGTVRARLGLTAAALADLGRACALPDDRRAEALLVRARVSWNEGLIHVWAGERSLPSLAEEVLPLCEGLSPAALSPGLRAEAEALLELVTGFRSGEALPTRDLCGDDGAPRLTLLEGQRRVLRGDGGGARAVLARAVSNAGCLPAIPRALLAAWVVEAQTPASVFDLDEALREVAWLIDCDPRPDPSFLLLARLARLSTLRALEQRTDPAPVPTLALVRPLVARLGQLYPDSVPVLLAEIALYNLSVCLGQTAIPGTGLSDLLRRLGTLTPTTGAEFRLIETVSYVVSSRFSPYPLIRDRSLQKARESLAAAKNKVGSRWPDELNRLDRILR